MYCSFVPHSYHTMLVNLKLYVMWYKRIITARKRSLGQGNIFTSVCQEFCSRLGVPPLGWGCLLWGGGLVLRGCLLWGVLVPGGLVSRPTPKGGIEGGQVQAHNQGGNWGGSGPGPPTATAAGSTHPTGIHSCYIWGSQTSFLMAQLKRTLPISSLWKLWYFPWHCRPSFTVIFSPLNADFLLQKQGGAKSTAKLKIVKVSPVASALTWFWVSTTTSWHPHHWTCIHRMNKYHS